MKFRVLDEKEFLKHSLKSDLITFYQSPEWAELKKTNGWSSVYVGVVDEKDNVICSSLILSKKLMLNKKMFYAPRGFLLDYNDEKLLEFFTKELKKYIKKNNGVFVKIDPCVIYKQRDINGDYVENGINNEKVITNLKKLGYKHHGFGSGITDLQPRLIFRLPLQNKTTEDVWNNFSKETIRRINKTKKDMIVIEKTTVDTIDDFCGIMEHTSKRRGFIDRPKEYYINMLNAFKDKIEILSAVLYTGESINNFKDKYNSLLLEKEEKEKLVEETNSKKSKDALRIVNDEITKIEKEINVLNDIKAKHGDRIVLASSMFIDYGKTTTYLFSGSYEEFMRYNAQYLIQWEIIKESIEHKDNYYDFYGINGVFDGTDGVYEFKKGFDGEVVEYIGEFDLITNKFFYFVYKVGFKVYKSIKNFFFKLHGSK